MVTSLWTNIQVLRDEINKDARIERIECLQKNRVKLVQSLNVAESYLDSHGYDRISQRIKRIDKKISSLMQD